MSQSVEPHPLLVNFQGHGALGQHESQRRRDEIIKLIQRATRKEPEMEPIRLKLKVEEGQTVIDATDLGKAVEGMVGNGIDLSFRERLGKQLLSESPFLMAIAECEKRFKEANKVLADTLQELEQLRLGVIGASSRP